MSLSINGIECTQIHYVGIFGSGMSALAQCASAKKLTVTGSDRFLDNPDTAFIRTSLTSLGCELFPQDGSGITSSTSIIIISTAIEDDNPDIQKAKRLGIPSAHRSDLLNTLVRLHTTIAVAGTSGKSTVTAMIFDFLRGAGKNPSVISGANLTSLRDLGMIGNAYSGTSDLLVIEADESDGSCTRYHPHLTVILNVSKDHKPVEETQLIFKTLASQSANVLYNADYPSLHYLGNHTTFGESADASFTPTSLECTNTKITLTLRGIPFALAALGRHNASNLLAALSACAMVGCNLKDLQQPVATFKGINRRFTRKECNPHVTVIDDFAHNPEKIRAALACAHLCGTRVIALFQPHGFGPTRFLFNELVEEFINGLNKNDILLLHPIYYVGGTAAADVSSDMLAQSIAHENHTVKVMPKRQEMIDYLALIIMPGDCIISMGARDPSLETFAAAIGAMTKNLKLS